ncbi:MAG: hypothetical protein D8M58_02510 [Calditrichaeota bacterium]|nr:MAG: hypothetical protein DWQ03_04570 [Calditrichota bacterium]MBL1204235.1 hypothetical protein [Calditrichota bacterium]NOG44065.1 hypothetical protein [Calditrichota bacterium]
MKVIILKAIIAFFVICSPVSGQVLENDISRFFLNNNETSLKGYLTPLSNAFGATLASSSYFSAKAYKFPHFDLGINYITTPIAQSEKTFGTDSLQSVTVFGKTLDDSSGIKGLDINSFNIPVLQLNIGVGDNTNLLLRYSEWKDKKVGKITIYGVGIKYELENLFSISPIPFNIGVLAVYQKYGVDDYIEGAVFSMNIVGSKRISVLPIEAYGGAGYINNVTNVSDPGTGDKVDISIPGLEEIRYQLGINFSILIFNLNAEYNFGDYKSISAGLRLIL